jgi:hypothetical protein
MILVECFMAQLEKILTDILNNMNEDDIQKTTNDHKSVHNCNNSVSNNNIDSNYQPKKDSQNALDFIIKEAILQWLSSPDGKLLIHNAVQHTIESKINIPVDYISKTLHNKLSDESIFSMFKSILKSNL